MKEKRKNLSLEDVRAELDDVKRFNEDKVRQDADSVMHRIIVKVRRGQYTVVGPNTIQVRLWFVGDYWTDQDRTNALRQAAAKYKVEVEPELALQPVHRSFKVRL